MRNRLTATPARTLNGLLFKVEVSAEISHTDHDMARSILNDLAFIGGLTDAA